MAEISVQPGELDFVVQRGSLLSVTMVLTYTDTGLPVVLSATQSVRGQIREEAGRYGASTAATLALDLTVANGALTILDLDPATIKMVVTPAQTIAMCADNPGTSRFYWALELFDSADATYVRPLFAGVFDVTGETAR